MAGGGSICLVAGVGGQKLNNLPSNDLPFYFVLLA